MRPRRIKFIIESSLENVPMIGNAISKICSQIPVSDVEAYQTELCIVEACNNVIEHAYQYESNHEIVVEASLFMDKIVFEISDTGQRFKRWPSGKLDFDPKDLGNLPEGGMGIFLMKNLMDEVEYRTENGKNILRLCKEFEKSSRRSQPTGSAKSAR